MFNKLFLSAVVMSVSVLGVLATQDNEAERMEGEEPLCVALASAPALTRLGPTAVCRPACESGRQGCLDACSGTPGCDYACYELYASCCERP
ncbi:MULTISPECIES: hypothetical protein [Myxococcus]|uniref:hypothetical protein n=1 Tax=Myxococcus TaxID=32 RepID=UPI0013D6ED56|nr:MULTISPECIES: hypothetical protein [Myxococcus]NVJ26178.1 hypothetical protein [Myxococcus sp. AM011]